MFQKLKKWFSSFKKTIHDNLFSPRHKSFPSLQGNRIIPVQMSTENSHGSELSNQVAFEYQPRVLELKRQMKPLLSSSRDDELILHPRTGYFYLSSELQKLGTDRAVPLGQIDLKLEEPLFRAAAHAVSLRRLLEDITPEQNYPINMSAKGSSPKRKTLSIIHHAPPITSKLH